MGSIVIQEQAWPLVVFTFPTSELSDHDMEDYLDQLGDILHREAPYALVTDTSATVVTMSARHLGLIDGWVKANADALRRLSRGNAIVVHPSPLLKGVLNALYRFRKPPNPHRVFTSFEEGASWSMGKLLEAGVLTEEQAAKRRSLLAPPPRRETRTAPPRQGALEASTPGQMGPIIDIFEEPAFLLTSAGEVVHANPAAARELPVTPGWLPKSVSTENTPLREHCRVTRVQADDGFLYLVVPNAELIPPPEMDPRLNVELSPSLDQVARLLAQGLSDKEIATATDRSLATVRTYVTRVFKKLDVHSRAELICLWSARARWAERPSASSPSET